MAASMDKLFTRELERNDDTIITINQAEIGDVGCVVWDAAIVLCKYLETQHFNGGKYWSGKNVIELGAGTGVVGIFAASYGADVIITDLPELLPLVEMNVSENSEVITGSTSVQALKWGEDKMTTMDVVDAVLLADCIYYKESLEPLVNTIKDLCNDATMVLCCYEQRDTGNKPELEKRFFELINKSFDVSEVPLENQDSLFRSDDIHIMTFRKKKSES